MSDAWVGFDVGGQAVKAAVVDRRGTILAAGTRATGLRAEFSGLSAAIGSLLDEFGKNRAIADAVGIGIAGVMGTDGVLQGSPNLPELVGEPIQQKLAQALGRPVVVDNDANCAALGEGIGGAADGIGDYLLITLGSGIGSGLVLGGRVYHGVTGYACELGHTIVVHRGRRCGCGNSGCLEAYASESAARALSAECSDRLATAIATLVRDRQYGYAQSFFELASSGDQEALRITAEMIEVLGTGLASAINLIDVTTIIVGGGIAPAVLRRRDELERAMDASLFARGTETIRVIAAARGSEAGAVGAACLAMSEL